MNKIIKKIQYSEKVYRFDVEAPLIAKAERRATSSSSV